MTTHLTDADTSRRPVTTSPIRDTQDMNSEEFVRRAYEVAEAKDIPAWIDCFNPDGAFSAMHRELYEVYVSGDDVIVELALQGTHDGPLWLPQGILPPTGNRMDAPCCDVFRLQNGRIQLFDCYPSGTVILSQLGVLANLGAALQSHENVHA
jgi:ketosteroid isomerase-like protein